MTERGGKRVGDVWDVWDIGDICDRGCWTVGVGWDIGDG